MMFLQTTLLQQISEIVKMLAVVAGGLWAAWTFHKLQKVRAAELGNRQTRTAIEKSRIEQEEGRTRLLRQQPQLAIEFHVTETKSTTKEYKSFLGISVTAKNEGEQNLMILFGPSPLTVGRKVFHKNGEETFEIQRFGAPYFSDTKDQQEAFQQRILRAGQKRRMALTVVPVTEPAAYFLQFRVLYNRYRFDGEKSDEKGTTIDAIEQEIYFATGDPIR